MADHFPDDAQAVPDERWLAHGLARGWTPLCKDGRIRGRHAERAPLEEHRAVLFYLDNQRLLRADMVRRFHDAQELVYRAVRCGATRWSGRVRGERGRHPPNLAVTDTWSADASATVAGWSTKRPDSGVSRGSRSRPLHPAGPHARSPDRLVDVLCKHGMVSRTSDGA